MPGVRLMRMMERSGLGESQSPTGLRLGQPGLLMGRGGRLEVLEGQIHTEKREGIRRGR